MVAALTSNLAAQLGQVTEPIGILTLINDHEFPREVGQYLIALIGHQHGLADRHRERTWHSYGLRHMENHTRF